MAEFIIAFLAGVGVASMAMGAWHIWEDRTLITHEFKERIGREPMGDLYGHTTVSIRDPLTDMSSNYAPATMPSTSTTGTVEGTYIHYDRAEWAPPPDGSWFTDIEFNDPKATGEATEGTWVEDADGYPMEVTSFGDEPPHEFDLGEALYGTPPPEAPHIPPTEFNDPIPTMEDALWADELARGYDPLEATPMDAEFNEAAHIAGLLEADHPDPHAEGDAAYLEALTGYESRTAPPNARQAIADALRTHPAP
jgi:hypothetical protein